MIDACSSQEAKPERGILDELLPPVDEFGEVGALDDSVIAGERDGHDQPSDDLVWVGDA